MNDVPVTLYILLHHDSVRATWDWRARKDPGRHGSVNRCRHRLPGRHARNDRQHPGSGASQGRCRDRIAIHCRIIESRCHGPGPDRLGKNAAKGVAERHGLGAADRCYISCNPGQCLVDADQRVKHVLTVTAAAR